MDDEHLCGRVSVERGGRSGGGYELASDTGRRVQAVENRWADLPFSFAGRLWLCGRESSRDTGWSAFGYGYHKFYDLRCGCDGTLFVWIPGNDPECGCVLSVAA